MRVGIIRGDLPGPLFMADLEPTSQIDFPVDPAGQSRYVSYPNATNLTNYMAGLNPDGLAISGFSGVPAGVASTAAVVFPFTLTGSNNVLELESAPTSFVAVTVATGTYSSMTPLLAAINAAIATAGVAVTAVADSTGTLVVIQSKTVGVGSFVGVGHTGGSMNALLNFATGADTTFTMPAATTIITALLPVGGPLNVSAASLLTNVGAAPAAAGIANLIAPQFVETETALTSFAAGNLAGYLLSTFSPDPNRLPHLATGAAVTVVQNDGTSAFSFAAPNITGAVHNSPNTGDLTISGTNLGNSEFFNNTVVRVTNPTTGVYAHIEQKLIAHTVSGGTTGSVSATSIVIPASLLNGLGIVGMSVMVKSLSLGSNTFTTT